MNEFGRECLHLGRRSDASSNSGPRPSRRRSLSLFALLIVVPLLMLVALSMMILQATAAIPSASDGAGSVMEVATVANSGASDTALSEGARVVLSRASVVDSRATASQDTPADLHASQQMQSINGVAVSPSTRPGKGDVVTYTITVTNTGGASGTANLTRYVPKNATYAGPITQGWSCPVGSGGGTSCKQAVDVPAAGSMQVAYTIVIGGTTGFLGSASAVPSAHASSDPAVLDTVGSISSVNGVPATASTSIGPGDQISYGIVVTNAGGSPGTTTLSDTVPVDSTYTGTTQGWSCSTGSAAGTACTQKVVVNAHSTSTVTYTVTVNASLPPSTIKVANTVRSTGGTCPQCSVTSKVSKADLSVASRIDHTRAPIRAHVTFTIKVLNNGPQTATDVALTDVPTGLTYVSSTPTQGTFDSDTGVWTIGALTKGSSATLIMVDAVMSASASNTSMAASPHELDPNVANSTATVTLDSLGNSALHGGTTIAGATTIAGIGTKPGAGSKPHEGAAAGSDSKSDTSTKAGSSSTSGGTSKSDAQEFAFFAAGVWRVIGLALVAVLVGLLVSPMVVRRWRINTWR